MYRSFRKPILDFIISLVLIIILLPLILIVALITLIHLGFPIIDVRIPREGKNKEPFKMYKFRTRIYDTNDKWGRKTKLSSFIDKTKLNELPQLFNVLIGNMSMVGPRAFICGETLPNVKIDEKRYLVKPGITGMAQVYGNENITHKEKLSYDVIYYDNMSFLLDLKILLKTPIYIIKQKKN